MICKSSKIKVLDNNFIFLNKLYKLTNLIIKFIFYLSPWLSPPLITIFSQLFIFYSIICMNSYYIIILFFILVSFIFLVLNLFLYLLLLLIEARILGMIRVTFNKFGSFFILR